MLTLGVETSCDDTSLCILKTDNLGKRPEVLAHESFSQEKILSKWGGIVPEIAASNHLEKLQPLIEEVFDQANLKLNDIDLIFEDKAIFINQDNSKSSYANKILKSDQ